MGYFVSLNTIQLFLDTHGEAVTKAYADQGINGDLNLEEHVLILITDKDIIIPVAQGDEEIVDWLDLYNLPGKVTDQWDNLERDTDEQGNNIFI